MEVEGSRFTALGQDKILSAIAEANILVLASKVEL